MAQFREFLPSENEWIHDLARGELHPEAEKVLQLGQSFNPAQMIEERTIQFLTELRGLFTDYAKLFNHHAESGVRFPDVKIYQVAHTSADFLLFRNTIKLIISNPTHGIIRIGFEGHRGDSQSSNETSLAPSGAQELLAQIGPFREVSFTFQGEKTSPEQVAKYYFTEFVRTTRDSRKNKIPNQALLDQVRALLKERGLDL